jgi:hypothetical protein
LNSIMSEPLDRSRTNALSAIKKVASDQNIDEKKIDIFLERLVDIGFNNQFNDLDRTSARSDLKKLFDEVTPLFESLTNEN